MDNVAIGLALIAVLFVLVGNGTYIAMALMAVGFTGILIVRGPDVALSQLAVAPFSGTAVFAFTVLPMFFLMGETALRSGTTSDLFRGFNAWLGRLPGGLGAATVTTSAMFAAISGSSVAVTQMMSRVTVPEMRKAGYQDRYSATVLAAAGGFAVLIPPSAMLVIYALLTEQSIGKALVSGLIPGLITIMAYYLITITWALRRPDDAPRGPSVSWGQRVGALRDLVPVAVIAVLVVGGIYTGLLTPTESAAAGAFAVILLGVARRRLRLADLVQSGKAAVAANAQVFLILIAALLFGRFIAVSGIGNALARWISGLDANALLVILAIVVMYLFMGTFLEGISVLVITVPLVAPIVEAIGYDLIWFGVVVVKMIEISLITPPLGLNVLVLSTSVDGLKIGDVWSRVWVFVVADLSIVALLIAFPEIVMWLPDRMGG